ncbi:MAG: hypothetical protein ABL958_18910, partial [Bdellovibrionia bacterium]
MAFRSLCAVLSLVLISCSTTTKAPAPEESQADFGDSTKTLNPPVVYYFIYKNDIPGYVKIDQIKWQEKWNASTRWDYFTKFTSITNRLSARDGLRHDFCFTGDAKSVAHTFFGTSPNNDALYVKFGSVETRAAQSGLKVGVRYLWKYEDKEVSNTFQIPHCFAGKSPIGFPANEIEEDGAPPLNMAKYVKAFANQRQPAQNADPQIGFKITDVPKSVPAGIPVMTNIRADYDRIQEKFTDTPWRNWQKLDLRIPADAMEFAVRIQKYVYEGMFHQDFTRPNDPDRAFLAGPGLNRVREWCHMPWMQLGNAGREALHGLTKERDLKRNKQYPNATHGSDWGVAYYNSVGCADIGNVFGTMAQPAGTGEIQNALQKFHFSDGTLSAKILFTTANFPEIKDAFIWKANVEATVLPIDPKTGQPRKIDPKGTDILPLRRVQDVRHIQMDVAIRDDQLNGVNPQMNNWVMLTYYFDSTYDYVADYAAITNRQSPLLELEAQFPEYKNNYLPVGFKKMRPMGIQTGFGIPTTRSSIKEHSTGDSIIFAGATTIGVDGRLNGPADNDKSSCFSCHGTAGGLMANGKNLTIMD